MSGTRPAVFLDRDGTLIEDVGYLDALSRIELFPWTVDALRALNRAGLALVVVTNQSGVGRGYFPAEALERQHGRLRELLAAESVELAGIYACVHAPDEGCGCRKPLPGLVLEFALQRGVALDRSVVVGGSAADRTMAQRLGMAHHELDEFTTSFRAQRLP